MRIASDIDGTLLDYDYIPGEIPAINWPLIRQLRERTDRIVLITNQGGLPFGVQGSVRKDGRRYPEPEDFVERLGYLVEALKVEGVRVTHLQVCVFHPKVTIEAVGQVASRLAQLLYVQHDRINWMIRTGKEWRKPHPNMLNFVEATIYYGDSDEDEQATQAAGIEFVRVERFFGGKMSFKVSCGSLDTMQLIAERGYKKLNPRSHKWQVVDKNAIYEIRNVQHFVDDEGQPYTCADLYADRNLDEIAKAKGLL